MALPYQCLVARASPAAVQAEWTLFGASGPRLVVQSSNGTNAVWPEQSSQVADDGTHERPGKRIKLEHTKEQNSNFSKLILSHDGRYLVGITGEDKCIRVFEVSSQSQLRQTSERCMTRRPCSIVLTPDDSTILCADKFGDVYALPLHPSPEDDQLEASASAEPEPEEKDFMPSATTLTVHSGRNRRTLEEQLKQKAKGILKSKELMKFKHELLLGHVSMLTDIVSTKVDGRSYIITADRDEHIRISRGQPQAHIVEGFCFGHESFVSRLCLTNSGQLISGGGDDHIYVWDWQNRCLLRKSSLRDSVINHLKTRAELGTPHVDNLNFKVAVSGIWSVPDSDSETCDVLVACEGIPALFGTKTEASASNSVIPLNGNALDVAFVRTSQGSCALVVSIDNIHEPASTSKLRNDNVSRLQCFSKQEAGQWQEDATIQEKLASFESQTSDKQLGRLSNGEATDTDVGLALIYNKVRDVLYSVENLRKRPGAED